MRSRVLPRLRELRPWVQRSSDAARLRKRGRYMAQPRQTSGALVGQQLRPEVAEGGLVPHRDHPLVGVPTALITGAGPIGCWPRCSVAREALVWPRQEVLRTGCTSDGGGWYGAVTPECLVCDCRWAGSGSRIRGGAAVMQKATQDQERTARHTMPRPMWPLAIFALVVAVLAVVWLLTGTI